MGISHGPCYWRHRLAALSASGSNRIAYKYQQSSRPIARISHDKPLSWLITNEHTCKLHDNNLVFPVNLPVWPKLRNHQPGGYLCENYIITGQSAQNLPVWPSYSREPYVVRVGQIFLCWAQLTEATQQRHLTRLRDLTKALRARQNWVSLSIFLLSWCEWLCLSCCVFVQASRPILTSRLVQAPRSSSMSRLHVLSRLHVTSRLHVQAPRPSYISKLHWSLDGIFARALLLVDWIAALGAIFFAAE